MPMTEDTWLAGDLKKALKYLHRRASERKRRLFSIACCRRVWQLLNGPQCHAALDVAEGYCDGFVSIDDLSEAESQALEAHTIQRDARNAAGASAADAVYATTCVDVGWDIADYAASKAASAVGYAIGSSVASRAKQTETAAQLKLLYEVFENPFRPVAFDPAWRTDTAHTLARQMYDAREFSAAPILADALQDAGCDSDDLLNHLREPNAMHVRGCWALDLVLGKE